jgi:excisionase family DNA binding protein
VNSQLGVIPAMEPYIEAGRAADYLSMSRKTLLKKARMGRLPAHPIGDGRKKMWRFRLSELDRWMQAEVTSGSDGGRSKERDIFYETVTISIGGSFHRVPENWPLRMGL